MLVNTTYKRSKGEYFIDKCQCSENYIYKIAIVQIASSFSPNFDQYQFHQANMPKSQLSFLR